MDDESSESEWASLGGIRNTKESFGGAGFGGAGFGGASFGDESFWRFLFLDSFRSISRK